jgi:hypothetical protein
MAVTGLLDELFLKWDGERADIRGRLGVSQRHVSDRLLTMPESLSHMKFPEDAPIPDHDRDHVLSCERIIAASQVLRGFANAYLDRPDSEVSALERTRLGEAADLMEQAMDRFS